MIPLGRRGKSLAIAAALFLLVTTLAHCQKQATFSDSCSVDHRCSKVFGRASVNEDTVFIKIKHGPQQWYKIISQMDYKHETFYRVKGEKYIGMITWTDTSLTVEVYEYDKSRWKTSRYIFNKRISE
jgi:hypothetical protein